MITDNIVDFPRSIRVRQFEWEEGARSEMRAHLGACVGLLHNRPTDQDLADIQRHLQLVADLLNCVTGVRRATGD
jgi:hypothetical protein